MNRTRGCFVARRWRASEESEAAAAAWLQIAPSGRHRQSRQPSCRVKVARQGRAPVIGSSLARPRADVVSIAVSAWYRSDVTASDTTARAAALQLRLYRQATSARRVQIAVELSDAVRETTLAGIRRRYP